MSLPSCTRAVLMTASIARSVPNYTASNCLPPLWFRLIISDITNSEEAGLGVQMAICVPSAWVGTFAPMSFHRVTRPLRVCALVIRVHQAESKADCSQRPDPAAVFVRQLYGRFAANIRVFCLWSCLLVLRQGRLARPWARSSLSRQ